MIPARGARRNRISVMQATPSAPDGSGIRICVTCVDHWLSAEQNSWIVQKLSGFDGSTIVAL